MGGGAGHEVVLREVMEAVQMGRVGARGWGKRSHGDCALSVRWTMGVV